MQLFFKTLCSRRSPGSFPSKGLFCFRLFLIAPSPFTGNQLRSNSSKAPIGDDQKMNPLTKEDRQEMSGCVISLIEFCCGSKTCQNVHNVLAHVPYINQAKHFLIQWQFVQPVLFRKYDLHCAWLFFTWFSSMVTTCTGQGAANCELAEEKKSFWRWKRWKKSSFFALLIL